MSLRRMKTLFSYCIWDPYIRFVLPMSQKIKAITVNASCMTVFLMGKFSRMLRNRQPLFLFVIYQRFQQKSKEYNNKQIQPIVVFLHQLLLLAQLSMKMQLMYLMTPRNFEYTLYLDEKQMTCFPKSTEKRISKCQSRLAAIELYSKCCMPYKKSSRRYEYRITECCQCLEWYHVYIYIYIYMNEKPVCACVTQ